MDKIIVLTGKFQNDITSIEKIARSNGFSTASMLTDETNLLLVGDGSKSYWATSETGKLIHQATRANNQGKKIEILYELEFISQVKNSTNLVSAEL
jgi:hypothetical protein